MRLLERDTDDTFSLTEFIGSDIPRYAILSHTWGRDGDEVIFKDIIEDTGSGKVGYNKIQFCGEQAKQDGIQYFWVDTCCIDKSSSAELSEAINSMFQWYRNAAKCYVFLTDVSKHCRDGYDTESQFRKSRWFTRGWTLQELIASPSVEFFSGELKRLGDKQSLEYELHEITGIAIQALRRNSLAEFSIAERMSWAEKRVTKREEDKAYSLMGIFNIHMSLIYGEGEQNAFRRLHEEINKSSRNYQHEKPPKTHPTLWIVPFERNPRFTGRDSQLAQLEAKLFATDQTTKIAITGLGGVGKTQLVLELLYRTKQTHANCSIIWIPATKRESLEQAYLHVAQELGIAGWEEKMADAKRLVQGYLSKESAGQWLFVFDNADDIDMWIDKTGSDQVSSIGLINFLPRSKQGCIVFTTRDRKTAVKLAHQNVVDVPEMNEEVATQLLQKCLIDQNPIKRHEDTTALLIELTYLPLAIVQAAAYINENAITMAEYLVFLREQEEEVIDLLSEDFEDDGRYRDMKNPVATTWLISFERIKRLDPLAAEYLSFMCCIDPRDIPQSLLPPAQSRKKETDAIGTLNAYSFVSRRSADKSLDLHRLVHLATRNWLRREGSLARWILNAVARLDEVFPDNDHKNRNVWRAYLSHARYILQPNLIDNEHPERIKLLWKYSQCLYRDGKYTEAEGLISQVIEIRKRVLGEEDPDTLISMGKLASTYRHQGRWKEAEKLEMQIMKMSKRVLGEEHPGTLTSIANLASIYSKQGRWKEAEELRTKDLNICKRVFGVEHPSTLTSIANLASTYSKQGRWKEAEELRTKDLNICERVFGVEHPSTLTSIANLASIYSKQGRWKEAEELQTRDLNICKKVFGVEHLDTLSSMANLALTYGDQGRWKEAEELEVQVMETKKRILGAEHPDTLTSRGNLASTYRNQGRWKEAEELEVQVMETKKRVLGAEHPNTLTSKGNLASTYRNQGRWKEAEELEVQVMETKKRVLGAEHPDTLTSIGNLASTYRNQGRWKEAEELEVQAMETSLKVLGAEHPSTLIRMANLASTYWNQGRWKEAEELEVQVMETFRRVLGQEHPSTLISMNNLAFIWKSQGRDDEALRLMQDCFLLRKQKLGRDHPNTVSSLEALNEWRLRVQAEGS
jgi:tetratricopeptide (TPR) repeat protein